jgi:hypothetical protein
VAAASDSDNTPVPGSVFTPRQIRMLKLAVIAMGVLLVGGFAFVLGTIVYQASRLGQDRIASGSGVSLGQADASIDLPVPQNATVAAISLDGSRLAVYLNSSAGPEIAVIDLKSRAVVARIKLRPQ